MPSLRLGSWPFPVLSPPNFLLKATTMRIGRVTFVRYVRSSGYRFDLVLTDDDMGLMCSLAGWSSQTKSFQRETITCFCEVSQHLSFSPISRL
jgi:hypothetical protein